MSTNRKCPNCSELTVPVQRLLIANCLCKACGAMVRAHWFYGTLFHLLTTVVTLVTLIVIYSRLGFYAALFMLPLPLGATGYLRARFCPLEVEVL